MPGNVEKAASWGRRCDVKGQRLKYTQGKITWQLVEQACELHVLSPVGSSGSWWEASPGRGQQLCFLHTFPPVLAVSCVARLGTAGRTGGWQGDRRWPAGSHLLPSSGDCGCTAPGQFLGDFCLKAATGGDWLDGVCLLLVSWGENDGWCQDAWGLCPRGGQGCGGG